MAKQINKNWALIESAGYTIEQGIGAMRGKKRCNAVPLRKSFASRIDSETGDDYLERIYPSINPGADLRWQALFPIMHAAAHAEGKIDKLRQHALEHCGACSDRCGFLCLTCARAIITRELARECNGEAVWAAARKGSALDKAMATMIAATPALRAEVERRALTAIIPTTPNQPVAKLADSNNKKGDEMENKNRASNENWKIFTAAEMALGLRFDNVEGAVWIWAEKRNDPESFAAGELKLSKETEALAVAVADLVSKRKSAKAAEKRFFKQLGPLLRAWGYDFASASALMTRSEEDERGHERFRYVIKDCILDFLMSKMIAESSTLSAEKERRALAALIPARPAPAHRAGWL